MAKKIKKKHRKKIKGKIGKGKTKTEYDDEIVELNRELAAVWQTVADVELHQERILRAYQAVRDNFDGIKENLQQDIRIEETKLEAVQSRLAWLESKKQRQVERYEKTISDLQADSENATRDTITAIEDKKTTLKILEHFDSRRRAYLNEEEKIAEAEKEQAKAHERELYEEDRKMRVEEAPVRAEAAKNLSTIFEPLLRRLEPSGIETLKILKSEENGCLENVIEKNSCRLLKLYEEFEQLKRIEWFLTLEIDRGGVCDKKNRVPERASTQVSVKEIAHGATQTEQIIADEPGKFSPLDEVENLVESVLILDELDFKREEFLEQQENILEMIDVKISELVPEKPKTFYVAGGLDYKRLGPNRLKLYRHSLYRNLRESNEKLMKKLQPEILEIL